MKTATLEVIESKIQSSFINIAGEQVDVGIYESSIDNSRNYDPEEMPSVGIYVRGGPKFRRLTSKS